MIMFGLYQTRSYYGKPNIMLETNVLLVPSFLGYFVNFFQVNPDFARYAEFREKNCDEEDEAVRWFLWAGCSSSNPNALYLNLYLDGSCNVLESNLGVSDFQIPFKTFVTCPNEPYYYSGDDSTDDGWYHDARDDNDDFYSYGQRKKLCSNILSEAHVCDRVCQGENNTDLYWVGRNAFLQVSNVSVSVGDTLLRCEDDFGRPEQINSGGEGEEISQEDLWHENGMEQRLNLYFNLNDPEEKPG